MKVFLAIALALSVTSVSAQVKLRYAHVGVANAPQVYAQYLMSRLTSRQAFLEEAIRARSRHV